ncbi:MAG TPA: putative metalloprotease CJM1_0395 family protein, partial [Thermohalobaculum sp.]|nr:putative metalloprotease CJM1_0395 family protein [Thermohalobaculum sp.]
MTAAIAPQPGARAGGTNPARGAAEAPLPVPAAGDTAGDAGRSVQPALGPEASRGLVLSQTTDAASPDGLSAGDRDVIRQMASRDREVHRHEQAHARAGGAHAGSPSFAYQTGPDGRRYAVAGSVPIDTAPVKGDPEAT